jgi:hypothetical protein
MGGNLFKLGRLPRQQYLLLEQELRNYLDHRFGDLYRIPRYYRSKPDFGDVDIVLSDAALQTDWPALRHDIVHELGIVQYAAKPNLLSTVFHDFQVDFFLVPAVELDSTWHFLCYNDLGNLLGTIYRRFNLKYGKDGLFYVFRRPSGNYRRDLLLSRDWRSILSFLDLKYERWDEGFETLEEMFAWVISCKYFTVRPFLERSARTAARVQERTTIQRFLAYLEENQITKAYPFVEDRADYLPAIAAYFREADLPGAIERERVLEERDRQVRARFSGKLVMELFPELQGEQLGQFIRQFKAQDGDFDAAMLAMTQEEIVEAIRRFRSQQIDELDSLSGPPVSNDGL